MLKVRSQNRRQALTLLALIVVTLLFGAFTGRAFAWQVTQIYQGDTLRGQPNGRNWSPSNGQLSGQVLRENNQRRSIAEANYHRWSQQAIDWMRAVRRHTLNYVPRIRPHR
jgi:hypothetical protein